MSEKSLCNPGAEWINKNYPTKTDGHNEGTFNFSRSQMVDAFNCGIIEANKQQAERDRNKYYP